jgi:GAF domain-containing protein
MRLWADSLILKDILDKLTRDLLSWPQRQHEINGAATRIGQELRHDRVFILVANEIHTALLIKDQYGVQTSIYGHEIPLEDSICGRAFRERKSILWNDVTLCPYFHRLTGDNTAAEMAAPITYRNEIFGILDVQSCQSNVFGPTDLHALQTVAQALGAAFAASRSETFFDEALALWQKLDEATSIPFTSEEEAFELFADFALDMLHANQVIYFPLSLSDCPTSAPFTRGEFHDLTPIQPPKNDPTSSLVCLVKKWRPLFEENVTADAIVARPTTDGVPSLPA